MFSVVDRVGLAVDKELLIGCRVFLETTEACDVDAAARATF